MLFYQLEFDLFYITAMIMKMIVVLPAKQIRCIQQPYVIVDLGFCPSPVPYCDVYVPLNSTTKIQSPHHSHSRLLYQERPYIMYFGGEVFVVVFFSDCLLRFQSPLDC